MTDSADDASPENGERVPPPPRIRTKQKRRRVRGKTAFQRIRDLPNFDVIHDKLCAGVSCESTARYLQESCGLCTDIGHSGLTRLLYRYRDTIPFHQRTPHTISNLEEVLQRESHKVNELHELSLMYEYQKHRIDKLVGLEKASLVLHPQTGHEVDRAARLLAQIYALKHSMGIASSASNPTGGVERDLDALEDSLHNGAVAVIVKTYGPDAPAVLTRFGRNVQEKLKQLKSGDANEIPVDAVITAPHPNGNGNGTHNGTPSQ